MKRVKSVQKVKPYELYDLKVVVKKKAGKMMCGHKVGDTLLIKGEMLYLPPAQPFSLYALSALLPLLPAKERYTTQEDWMSVDDKIACPDANCSAYFKIIRIKRK